ERSLLGRHVNECKRGADPAALQRDDNLQLRGGHAVRLIGKPATLEQERRQHVVLKRMTLATAEQRIPTIGPNQGGKFARDDAVFGLRLRLIAKQEPEEAIGRERNVV